LAPRFVSFQSIKVSGALPKAVKLPTKPYVWIQPYLLPPVQTITYIIEARQNTQRPFPSDILALLQRPLGVDEAGARSINPVYFSGLKTTAALANPYDNYSFQYGGSAAEGQDGQEQDQSSGAMYGHGYLNHDYSTLSPSYYPLSMQSEYNLLHQQLQSTMITQPNTSMPHHTQDRNSIATSISSQLSGSTRYEDSRRPSEYDHSEPLSRKRSRADDFQSSTQESPIYNNHLSLNMPAMMASNGHQTLNQMSPFQFRAPRLPQATSTDRSPLSDTHQLQLQQPHSPDKVLSTNQHHHHHMPPHSPTLKRTKHGEDELSMNDPGPPSMVGKEGMPEPAARPKGPKLKFTREDDALLVRLKESKNLTWKQIAEFFPGRSAGTLQVRYCTKLKAKTTLWNDDMVSDTFPFFLSTALPDWTTGQHAHPQADKERASQTLHDTSICLLSRRHRTYGHATTDSCQVQASTMTVRLQHGLGALELKYHLCTWYQETAHLLGLMSAFVLAPNLVSVTHSRSSIL
jgi:hypothetical protein